MRLSNIVLTDIRLGGEITGWDVGVKAREIFPDIPVIYVSGAVVEPPRHVPNSVFFDKPYDPAEVVKICRGLCEGG